MTRDKGKCNNATELHPVQWTPERAKRFFDHFSAAPSNEFTYFSRQRGRALLRYVRGKIGLSGPALDMGCGPGYLLEMLAEYGVECCGADVSPDSIAEARTRLEGNPLVREISVLPEDNEPPWPPESFDMIFLLEVMEHLSEGVSDALLKSAGMMLKHGGHLIATTPFNEDLEAGAVGCPACGCLFHRMQHIRSFTAQSLLRMIKDAGFAPVVCRPKLLPPEMRTWLKARRNKTDFPHICPECGENFHCGIRPKRRGFLRRLMEIPHLVCIAQRED